MFAKEKELLKEALENYRDALKPDAEISDIDRVALHEDITIAASEADLWDTEDPELEVFVAMVPCLEGNLARVESALAWVLTIEPYEDEEEEEEG